MKLFISAFLLFAGMGPCVSMHADKTDLPFANDPALIGKWVSVDYVHEPTTFVPGQPQDKPDLYISELTFMPDGKTSVAGITWTKGAVLKTADEIADSYEFKDISGTTYLIMQWKTGDYTQFGMKPRYLVMKKQ